MEHTPRVMPAAIFLLVAGVFLDTLRSAPSLGPGQWAAASLGISVGALIGYFTALRSRIVFDTIQREVRWHPWGWPGKGRGACPLIDLTAIQLLGVRSSGEAQGLALLTSRGSIPLTRQIMGLERSHEKTAASLRDWLARQGYDVPIAP